jgi:hypothetical protein
VKTFQPKEVRRIQRLAAVYNMIPNLVWTALFLSPVAIFCYTSVSPKSLFIVLGICLIPLFFPNSFFNSIQLSRSPKFYTRLGVKYINMFAQHGTLLNKYLRAGYPTFKTITANKASIKKQYNQTFFFEKFHFSLFLFYTSITVYALAKGLLLWSLIVTICNLFYNVYPNLLQQYIRAKLVSPTKQTRDFSKIKLM